LFLVRIDRVVHGLVSPSSPQFAATLTIRLHEAIAMFEHGSRNASVVRSDGIRVAAFTANYVVSKKIYAGALNLKNIFKK